MKSPILVLPTLLQIGLVAALCFATTPATVQPAYAPAPASELLKLRAQRDQIEARVEFIESRTRVFLPRGMGRVANHPAPGVSSPIATQDLAPQQESK
jgi:hypothetical protein